MNEMQQRLRIAEICGLFRNAPPRRTNRRGKDDPNGVVIWFCSASMGGEKEWDEVPNYPGDLNACRVMEKALTAAQWDAYGAHLMRGRIHERIGEAARTFAHASAALRCEAFLKAHGVELF